MDINKQENNYEIKELRKMLKLIDTPSKTENEWKIFENELFSELDTLESTEKKKKKAFTWPKLFTAPVRYGTFATLFIAALSVFIYNGYQSENPKQLVAENKSQSVPLLDSKILNVHGEVSIENGTIETSQQTASIHNGQILTTGNNASITVKLEKGTDFLLRDNSLLKIKKAVKDTVELFLEKGYIIASVSKRTKDAVFSVTTPNAICNIVGTIFSVSVNNESTTLEVVEGRVSFKDKADSPTENFVDAGRAMSIEKGTFSDKTNISDTIATNHYTALLNAFSAISANSDKEIGLLDINSKPDGAIVRINGEPAGITPVTLQKKPGNYNISVTYNGYKVWNSEIEVVKDNASFVNTDLVKSKPRVKNVTLAKTEPKKSAVKYEKEIEKKISSPESTKDFGFIFNPSFVEALMQITIGEYEKALNILDSLKDLPQLSIPERFRIMSKIASCNRKLGDFEATLANLTERYRASKSVEESSNLLWEIINIKSSYLEDYEGAEKDIHEYIKTYPKSSWIEAAYEKLGELQYLTGKFSKAVGTYQYHINYFNQSPTRDRSMYTLANILRLDLKDTNYALKWYNELIKSYPKSVYIENALFERAECYERIGMKKKAIKEFKKYITAYPNGHLTRFTNLKLAELTK